MEKGHARGPLKLVVNRTTGNNKKQIRNFNYDQNSISILKNHKIKLASDKT